MVPDEYSLIANAKFTFTLSNIIEENIGGIYLGTNDNNYQCEYFFPNYYNCCNPVFVSYSSVVSY